MNKIDFGALFGIAITLYLIIAVLIFLMHTQLPVTLSLALLRSLLWPVWILGGLQGKPLRMD